MPHNDALLQVAVGIVHWRTGLAQHLPQGGFGHGGIIPRGGKLGRQVRAGIFYIGQPNIYVVNQCLDGLQRLIPTGIVDDRQGKTCRPCGIQRGQHPGQVLGGGDKV